MCSSGIAIAPVIFPIPLKKWRSAGSAWSELVYTPYILDLRYLRDKHVNLQNFEVGSKSVLLMQLNLNGWSVMDDRHQRVNFDRNLPLRYFDVAPVLDRDCCYAGT